MLEIAYVSAEHAQPSGGGAFLKKFTRLLAANHTEAIRYEPTLAQLFHEPVGTPVTETPLNMSFPLAYAYTAGELTAPLSHS